MSYKIVQEREVVTREVAEIEVSLLQFIGHQVSNKRKAAGINIAQMSRRLEQRGVGISGATLGRIEKGVCALKIEDLKVIADYFECGLSDFLPQGA